MKRNCITAIAGVMLTLASCGQDAQLDAYYDGVVEDMLYDLPATYSGADIEYSYVADNALYDGTLRSLVVALNAGCSASDLEIMGFSPEYHTIMDANGNNGLSNIGYAMEDINGDGNAELLLGDIDAGVIYDIYTLVNEEPKLVASGNSKDKYYLLHNSSICKDYSGGALENGWTVYTLSNTADLNLQYGYKYDGYQDEDKPWFKTDAGGKWVSTTEEEFNEALDKKLGDIAYIDFKPLSSWNEG